MSLQNRKITDSDISAYGVISAPDRLTGTAAENKAVFDKLIKQAVKVKINELIDDLMADIAASQLGAQPPDGLSGGTVQAVIQSLKDYTDENKVAKDEGKGLSSNDYTDADKELVAQVPAKADLSSVLSKNNTEPYEPSGDYNPCTKKYADNLAFSAGAVTSVFGRAGAVVAQAGDYTPQQVGAEPAFSVLPESKGGTGQASLQGTRNAMGLGNTLGVLPVANGGTGQSSLSNVTVGNASKLGTINAGSYAREAGAISGDLIQWAMTQGSPATFGTGPDTTNLPPRVDGGSGTQYYRGIFTGTSSNAMLIMFDPGAMQNSFFGAIRNGEFRGWVKILTDQNTPSAT